MILIVLILNSYVLLLRGTFYAREPQTRDPDKSGLTLEQHSWRFNLISKQTILCTQSSLINYHSQHFFIATHKQSHLRALSRDRGLNTLKIFSYVFFKT